MSAISECEEGLQPASPNPTPSRASPSVTKPVAKPLSAVNPLHSARDPAIIAGRLARSAAHAMGTPRKV